MRVVHPPDLTRPWVAFYLLVPFGLDFANWIFTKNFQTLLEMKADINRAILTSCSTYVLKKLPLGGANDRHFSFSQRSCKIGLMYQINFSCYPQLRYLRFREVSFPTYFMSCSPDAIINSETTNYLINGRLKLLCWVPGTLHPWVRKIWLLYKVEIILEQR